jgi:pleiotropic regulator 1
MSASSSSSFAHLNAFNERTHGELMRQRESCSSEAAKRLLKKRHEYRTGSERLSARRQQEQKNEKNVKNDSKFALIASSSSSATSSSSSKVLVNYSKERQSRGTQVNSKALVASVERLGGRSNVCDAKQLTELRARHGHWRMKSLIVGHLGWVHCLAVHRSNDFFVSGSADRTIKVWDLASGKLRLTLTGHMSAVRAVGLSEVRPMMVSASEDNRVNCWDLEKNRVVRKLHAHRGGVYALALHPRLDLAFTAGSDKLVRVWDVRSPDEIMQFAGHRDTIQSLACQSDAPQLISGAADRTVRCWDLVAGRCRAELTHHRNSVRAIAVHPIEYAFASASTGAVKLWQCPDATPLASMRGHESVINALAINDDGMLASAGNDGSLHLCDWHSRLCFQTAFSKPQAGSLQSEAGIMALAFDRTGRRLITAETDKSIKVYAA